MLRKSTLREIKRSLGRYLAIMAIVALGVGFFAGLKVTKEDMIATADKYLSEYDMYDFEMFSTLGFNDRSVEIISDAEGVKTAEGSVSKDILVEGNTGDSEVIKFMSLTRDINTLRLKSGRLPERADECVVDADQLASSLDDESALSGEEIVLSGTNDEDDLDAFKYRRYKVVGTVTSPLYMNFERGSSEIGSGSVKGFAVIPEEGFDSEYYTEVYVSLSEKAPSYSEEYEDLIDRTKPEVKKAGKTALSERHQEIVDEAKEKLEKQKKKYRDGVKEFRDEKKKAYDELASALSKIQKGEKELKDNRKKIKKGWKDLKANKKRLKKEAKKLKSGNKELRSQQKKLDKQKAALAQQKAQLEASKDYMPEEAYRQAMAKIAAGEKKLSKYQKKINKGYAKARTGAKKIRAGRKAIKAGRKTLKKGERELRKGEKKIKDARRKYRDGKRKADEKFAEAEADLASAKKKLDKAEKKIKKIKKGKSYVYGREINIGYSTFENNAGIVESIATIFPLFFFMVAALVCMTTMTRMIDEQRTQIGVLKALGYSNAAVLSEYMFYSGSAALAGAVAGFFIGCRVFPSVIWHAYGMMLNFADRDVEYIINKPLLFGSLITSLLCSMGATWFSCSQDFTVAPAQLIRPKSPKAGKRILLERITPVWKRIGFLYKVSLRNIFRYKKRLFMMVAGISGCTALLIAGFGISTTVKNVARFQYDEISLYDYQMSFEKNMTDKRQADFREYMGNRAEDILFIHSGGADITAGRYTTTVDLISCGGEGLHDFVDLHDSKGKIDFPGDGEIVVSRKFRDHYNVKVGDTLAVKEGSKRGNFKVSGIADNFVYNYVYVSRDTYENVFGKEPAVKSAFVKDTGKTDDEIRNDAAYAARYEDTGTVSVNADMVDRVDDMMVSLDAVILAVILSAALLAFIVLYNLTNINITEREREIATIKVLGFYAPETSQYIFRENFFLTGISAVVGIPLGKALLDFVVDNIRIDLIFFVARITAMDYVKSVALTFLFAVIVAIVMYRKLYSVSMTESLKSAE